MLLLFPLQCSIMLVQPVSATRPVSVLLLSKFPPPASLAAASALQHKAGAAGMQQVSYTQLINNT